MIEMKTIVAVILLVFLVTPSVTQGEHYCNPGEANVAAHLCKAVGVANIPDFIKKVMVFVGTIIGTLAILMVVYSGFQMIIARGDSDALTKAKTGFTYAISGFVVSILAFIIVVAIQQFIGARSITEPELRGLRGILNPLTDPDLLSLMRRILRNFLGIVGVLAVLMIIISGFRYVLSAGNEEQAEKAKKNLQWSVVGLIAVLLAYVIVKAVATFFGG